MSRICPIQIRKHTPKRYKKSKWYIDAYWIDLSVVSQNGMNEPLVTDLTKKSKTTTPLPEYEKGLTTYGYSVEFVSEVIDGLKNSSLYAKPKKPSFLRNIKHHTIDKLRRKI